VRSRHCKQEPTPKNSTGFFRWEGGEGKECEPGDLPECRYVPLRVKGLVAVKKAPGKHSQALFLLKKTPA